MKNHLHKQSLANCLQFVALVAVLFLSSCATRAKFLSSTVVPAAQGEVKVDKDNNNNYSVKLSVENLAEPNRLAEPKNVYVVWADTDNGIQNLGQLDVSKSFLSGKLKASLQTVTPYKPTRVFITGENTARVTYPGNYIVLNTNSF
jgi:hypothetical protein